MTLSETTKMQANRIAAAVSSSHQNAREMLSNFR